MGVEYLNFQSICTQICYSPLIASGMPAQPLLPCKLGAAVLAKLSGKRSKTRAALCGTVVLSAGQAAAWQALSTKAKLLESQLHGDDLLMAQTVAQHSGSPRVD